MSVVRVYSVTGWVLVLALLTAGCVDPGQPQTVSTGGYSRAAFGSGWADFELPRGCDTRDEVLARDAATATYGRDGCVVTVAIIDPYTDLPVSGRSNIDIDHVVSLKDAWQSGASAWTDEQRRRFANDKVNLLATADEINAAKSDRGPDRWRPPSQTGWCVYAGTYARTKNAYQLAVTDAQLAAVADLTSGCGGDR